MGRPRIDRQAPPTTDRVLEAAEAEFGQKGLDGARLADIAAQAGIRRPSLLYHYPTKDALYEAVVRHVFWAVGQDVQAVLGGGGDFETRLTEVVTRFGQFMRERPNAARLLLRELLSPTGPGHTLILEEAEPVLAVVEAFIKNEAGDAVRPGVPVRDALLAMVTSTMVKAASGPLELPLWRGGDRQVDLARYLLLEKIA